MDRELFPQPRTLQDVWDYAIVLAGPAGITLQQLRELFDLMPMNSPVP